MPPRRTIVAPSATATSKSCVVPIDRRSRPCSAASSARRAKKGRLRSGSSVAGGIVISPVTGTGAPAMNSPSAVGASPALPSSPATSTSTRASGTGSRLSRRDPVPEALVEVDGVSPEPAQRRLGGDGVDEPYPTREVAHLAALKGPDEVPGEEVAVVGLLGREVLGAVLADELDARLGEGGKLRGRHVLDRRAHLDAAGIAAGCGYPPPPARGGFGGANGAEAGG